MAIETRGRDETLRSEGDVGRVRPSFEDLYHLKDNRNKGEPRKTLKRSARRMEGKAGKCGVC